MNKEELKNILKKHKDWINGIDGGEKADLRYANLRGVKLKSANLGGADIDYSSWPLWCGSLGVKVDKRIAAQLAYHFCRLDCDDPAYIKARNAILDFANQFHRVGGCGRLSPGCRSQSLTKELTMTDMEG